MEGDLESREKLGEFWEKGKVWSYGDFGVSGVELGRFRKGRG